ncbi:MAG TPA: PSD1 and planctomycete cytochrome C domain-containing protein [Bryobacteraceae bacterium]|nr:PSD1 and planctomycete cytochrome C domain-containing protein [Bryobacteraceae bacterium]
MPGRIIPLIVLVAVLCFGADQREDFETRVRPLLATKCWGCHGPSAMGGLRLDSREAMLKGGNSGPAVIPAKAAESLLVRAITHQHERLRMPPPGKLPENEIEALIKWIDAGAYWPAETKAVSGKFVITPAQRAFWAFQPVKAPLVPQVRATGWPRNAIDRFVLARLEKEGLRPVRQADKRTLIRRATFDLIGLPPTPQEVDTFLHDTSADAFAKVVDRLLASPHYGERWGRYWLDVARYSDDRFNSTKDDPYPNSWRYRNWVIRAFNEDMPWDTFVRAQIAGDQMTADDPMRYAPGLGFYSLSPEMQDDRVDATTRGFLGLTVACAQCHDHKFDPIPTIDFYSLQGVFTSTELHELPLAPKAVVDGWEEQKKKVDKQQALLDRFYDTQRQQIAEILASQTVRYLLAAQGMEAADDLDQETLERWKTYLNERRRNHPFLKKWFEQPSPAAAAEVQERVLAVIEEKKEVDEKNRIILGLNPDRSKLAGASLVSLDRETYMLWRDLFERSTRDSAGFFKTPDGVYYYGKGKIERFLEGRWKSYLDAQQAELERLKKALPSQYPFLQTICDRDKPADVRVQIRGDRNNPGEVAPRRFLAILDGDRRQFTKGSGRLELAQAIADLNNPLTARVIVNRVWQHHFGRGIVGTPSNFGQLGARPTHPELLDHLAHEFVANGWSVKKLHRSIMLSATYSLSAGNDHANGAKDPANLLLWRANRRRLDAESLRDSMLFVSGQLDATPAEKAAPLDEKNNQRTVYGFVSRRKLDGMLALFDFPNPNSTSEARNQTNVPLQRLFLMNSGFVDKQAQALAARFGGDSRSRIRSLYAALFGREPRPEELKLGLEYAASGAWPNYTRVLLSSNEFLFVD